jgi:hypothetical protein
MTLSRQIKVQASTRIVFLAIAAGKFESCEVKGPSRAAAVGALKRKGLIDGQAQFALTEAGIELHAKLVPPAPVTKQQVDPKAKAARKPRDKAEEHPRHNERTMGYVRCVRDELGSAVAEKDDETIAQLVWRVATGYRAVAKVREAFGL